MPTPPTLDDVTRKAKTEAVNRPRDDALTKSSGAQLHPKGVIFLLGVGGHGKAGYSPAEAKAEFDRTKKFARNIAIALQNEQDLEVEPYEILEFNTLSELISKRPGDVLGGRWFGVYVVTHAQGEQPAEMPNSIFFGDRDYFALSLFEFADAHKRAIEGFRKVVDPDSPLRIIGCAPASHGSELGSALREFFGTRGPVLIPKVDVRLTETGFLYTPVPDTKDTVRALRDDDWLLLDPKPGWNQPD